MLPEVSGERYLCGVTGKKGRKPVDELTRGQGSMRHRSIAQPLVPLSTRQLVSFLSIPFCFIANFHLRNLI